MTIEAEALRTLAPAKINLFLHVGQKRADGYHALQSLVAFTQAGDELALCPARDFKLVISGPFGTALQADDNNLVMKAARALAAHVGEGHGAYMSLKKNLPVASGIGGGSADAAATLRGLSRLWDLKLPPHELRKIAEKLGSDVPVCISCGTQWMEGRGEVLTELEPLPGLPMVLVNPGVSVPTPRVFAALKQRRGTEMSAPTRLASAADLVAFLKDTENDLEAPAGTIAPVIGEVLGRLRAQTGVCLARMSGSGATCFALFSTDSDAEKAAAAISADHPRWWTVATHIVRLSPAALLA